MADVELLPLPEPVVVAEELEFGAIYAYERRHMEDYARANMEPLRAEVELWRHKAAIHKYRRKRLAEALRELVDVFSESGMYDEEVFDKARAELEQEKCDAQQPANDEVVFIDGVGAGRSSIKSCRDGVQWIVVGDRVYWPLSDSDAKRLQSACCGNGSFDGPATPAVEGEQQ